MPIYEYLCKKCGEFEVTQRITDDPLARCPTCRGKVKKLISNTSFQLKGSGWYVTDYARKGSEAKKETGETKSDGSSGGEGAGGEKEGKKEKTEVKKETKDVSKQKGGEKAAS